MFIALVLGKKQLADCAQEHVDVSDKVHRRYYSYNLFQLMVFSIAELDAQCTNLQFKEQQWPMPLPVLGGVALKRKFSCCNSRIHFL